MYTRPRLLFLTNKERAKGEVGEISNSTFYLHNGHRPWQSLRNFKHARAHANAQIRMLYYLIWDKQRTTLKSRKAQFPTDRNVSETGHHHEKAHTISNMRVHKRSHTRAHTLIISHKQKYIWQKETNEQLETGKHLKEKKKKKAKSSNSNFIQTGHHYAKAHTISNMREARPNAQAKK